MIFRKSVLPTNLRIYHCISRLIFFVLRWCLVDLCQSFDKFFLFFFTELYRAIDKQHHNVGGGNYHGKHQRNSIPYRKDHECLQENVSLDIYGGSNTAAIK